MDEIAERIHSLKTEKNAVILAHYYQPLEVQDVADVVGDSFALAQRAQKTAAQVIVLCGVRFMAESAKILNPDKTVYLPVSDAGCPMADMVTAEDVRRLKAAYPDAAVVCYVNSSAAVKAESDVCCTSSSAERILRSLPQERVIFVPDRNLGEYLARKTGKEVILHEGWCPIHHEATAADVQNSRTRYPDAELLVHPETRPEVSALADFVGSTAEILDYARSSLRGEFIIGTERGVAEILRREFPNKGFYLLREDFICADMKKTGLPDVLRCLEGNMPPLELPPEEMEGARRSLERMIFM